MGTKEPPLVDVKVSNPVTYLRRWWDKVMGKEGIDFSFKIHPITAVLITSTIVGLSFGAGRYSINIPFLNYELITSNPTPTGEPVWKETAYTGKLQYSDETGKFFLITTSSEAITLEVPETFNLLPLVDKRIFAVGNYNRTLRLLKINDVKDLEVLPKTPVPIPTNNSTPAPLYTPTPSDLSLVTPRPTSAFSDGE